MIPGFKPMLAASCEDVAKLRFPLLATPKIDGIRCVTVEEVVPRDYLSVPLSRSLKAIPNRHIYDQVSRHIPPWCDGELVVGSTFQESSSGIMSFHGTPGFKYMIFDTQIDSRRPYSSRVEALQKMPMPSFVQKILPVTLETLSDLDQYLVLQLGQGFEGVCLRHPSSPYKHGRSTFREHYLIKIKVFEDMEGEVVGFEELYHNANEAKISETGHMVRSTHQENMIPTGRLGSLIVRILWKGEVMEFHLGSGFNEAQRQEIWANQQHYAGRNVKFKYQPHGSKDAPRTPIFLGFRNDEDMSE